MNKSIIELIASDQSAKAVSVVEKTLGKKLLKAISEQATKVARQTYGTVQESYGAEQPEFVNPSDNTYAAFFANALKKFGVNGPEDFRDEATKQQFFQYVDNNWKAQDSVQGIASQAAPGPTMDQGTGTQLPATATQPQAPQMPMQTALDTTAPAPGNALGGTDPSLSAMSNSGNANGDSALTPGGGNDGQLDNVQNAQQMGGTCSACGQPMPEPQVCKCCGQTVPAGSGMPGQPMPGQQVQPGADMGDDDSDPDLEIGDEDQADGDDTDFGQDPEDEQGLGSNNNSLDPEDDNSDFGDEGDEDGGDVDPNDLDGDGDVDYDDDGNLITDPNENPDADEDAEDAEDDGYDDEDDEDEDNGDPFDDEDAYSVSPNDFSSDDSDDDDEDAEDEDGDPDLEIGDDGDEDDEDSDDEDSDEDSDEDGDENGDVYDDEADDDDSDDEDSDDDDDAESDDDGDDEVVVAAPPKKKSSKKSNPFARNEDFGAGLDNAEDKVFITEFLDPMIKKTAKTDKDLHKKLKSAKVQLRQIKVSRNQHLSMLRKKRAEIMADPSLSPEQKQKAKGHIAKLGKKHMKHCKQQAQGLKALHTGRF